MRSDSAHSTDTISPEPCVVGQGIAAAPATALSIGWDGGARIEARGFLESISG
jgi:hypothetical protein